MYADTKIFMNRLYEQLSNVYDFYNADEPDEDTLRHINIKAQIIAPGPYVIVYTHDMYYDVVFKWENPQQQTWYTLKWS